MDVFSFQYFSDPDEVCPDLGRWHVCGAYLRNSARGHGLRDESNRPVEPLVTEATRANRETLEWVAEVSR